MSHTPYDTSFAIANGRALLPVAQAWYALRACRRYDEEAARRWFSSKKTSPLTGATLTDLTLVSNFAIKKQIDAYLEVRALLHHCPLLDERFCADSRPPCVTQAQKGSPARKLSHSAANSRGGHGFHQDLLGALGASPRR